MHRSWQVTSTSPIWLWNVPRKHYRVPLTDAVSIYVVSHKHSGIVNPIYIKYIHAYIFWHEHTYIFPSTKKDEDTGSTKKNQFMLKHIKYIQEPVGWCFNNADELTGILQICDHLTDHFAKFIWLINKFALLSWELWLKRFVISSTWNQTLSARKKIREYQAQHWS